MLFLWLGFRRLNGYGADVWPAADGCVLLYSGIPVPSTDVEVVVKREGVRILLNKKAAYTCTTAGEI